MSRVGHVSEEHLIRMCGLAVGRIRNYVKDGYVEKVAYKDKNGMETCYKLTRFGREVAEKYWSIRDHYHSQNPIHDLALANKYFSLPESIRDTWRTETEVRNMFQEQLVRFRDQGEENLAKLYEDMLKSGFISMPDAIYTNEKGVQVAFEVVTNSYGREELQAKEMFIGIMNLDCETIRV